jgi:hypothetical protein
MPRKRMHGKLRIVQPARPTGRTLDFCYPGSDGCHQAAECQQECLHSQASRRLGLRTAEDWQAYQRKLYAGLEV